MAKNNHCVKSMVVAVIAQSLCTIVGCTQISGIHSEQKDISAGNWQYDLGAVVRGDCTRKEIALIFTAGEHGEGTSHILDVLRRTGIKAGMFLTGDYLANPQFNKMIPRMIDEGHYVGPHSHAHLLYCSWENRTHSLVTSAEFKQDLMANIEQLRSLGALRPGQQIVFIPPYEWYNRQHVLWAKELGVMLFNFTPGSGSNGDWIPESHPRFRTSHEILSEILEHEAQSDSGLNGFILLLHLGSTRQDKVHTILESLLGELAYRGYRFVRIDHLLQCADQPTE